VFLTIVLHDLEDIKATVESDILVTFSFVFIVWMFLGFLLCRWR